MDAETGKIVAVVTVVVVGIILAATCDYLLCGILGLGGEPEQGSGKLHDDFIEALAIIRETDAKRRELEQLIREYEDKLNEFHRYLVGKPKNKNLSTYQKIKLF
jgi:hypothetical protein